MSMVELRRNSSPHLASLSLQSTATPPAVWRKTSHPPLTSNPLPIVSFLPHPLAMQVLDDKEVDQPSSCSSSSSSSEDCSSEYEDDVDAVVPRKTRHKRRITRQLYERMLLHSDDFTKLVRNIMADAKRVIKAETCSLFLLDSSTKELVAKVFDKAGDLSEIRLPADKGIVGRVAMTRTMMNVREVYRCPFFCPKIDQLTGFVTRNILCFPITDNAGTFIGVVELCNKEGRSGFTRIDEKKAKTFAVYCATSISHCLLYKKVQEAQCRNHMAGEWLVKDGPLTLDPEEVTALANGKIKPWSTWHPQFDRYSFSPRSIGGSSDYAAASMTMFEDLGLINIYRMDQGNLANFVLRVANGYRDVPYHNWSHAFAVAHFCWLNLRTSAVRHNLTELERLSLMIACLCHDIDHRGTTNKFQVQANTPLALLYSSEGSVLERHHYAQTVEILQDKKCDILKQLTRTQYQCVMSHIRDVILATDIAAHIGKVERIKTMTKIGFKKHVVDHHYLFMCLIMTASDLSDQSKNFRNSKAIAENIYKEFFSQGDIEKQMGSEPMTMMDREKANVAQIQLEFMDTVALPVFEMLSHMVEESNSTFVAITHNRRCWKALDGIMKKRGEGEVNGLDYLRDEKVERDVLEEVEKEYKENQSLSLRLAKSLRIFGKSENGF